MINNKSESLFVTGFNGARDYYQLPVALYEHGLLAKHVTDLYLPNFIAHPLRLRGLSIGNRSNPLLQYRETRLSIEAFLRDARIHMGKSHPKGVDPYFLIDRAISLSAARVAEAGKHSLLLHSGYGFWAFEQATRGLKGLFQFHPHSAPVLQFLEADYLKHPEVKHSFENESDSQPLHNVPPERLNEWKLADFALCASTFTKSTLISQGMKEENIHVIPYGSDNIAPAPSESVASDGVCKFLFVGQGVQRKGLHHLLKAWERLSLKDATLTIVARRMDPGVGALIPKENVIHIAGATSSELHRIYSYSDIFLMPSLVEGFGLVYLEALKYGLPCVATNNTGVPDLNLSSEFALCCTPGDIDDLSERIHTFYLQWKRREIDKKRVAASIDAFTWAQHRQTISECVRLYSDKF